MRGTFLPYSGHPLLIGDPSFSGSEDLASVSGSKPTWDTPSVPPHRGDGENHTGSIRIARTFAALYEGLAVLTFCLLRHSILGHCHE